MNIQALLDYRQLWPKLLNDIQGALPQSAKKNFGAMDPSEIKKIPRTQRQVVLIESVQSQYVPNLTGVLAQQDIRNFAWLPGQQPPTITTTAGAAQPTGGEEGGGGAAPGGAPPDPNTAHGFIVTMALTTPFANGPDLVNKQLIPALKSIKPTTAEHRRYAIVNAQMKSFGNFQQNPARIQKMKSDYQTLVTAMTNLSNIQLNLGGGGGGWNPGGGGIDSMEGSAPGGMNLFGGRGGMAPMPGAAALQPQEDQTPLKDRATGELLTNDWEIILVMVVQIDPPPAVAPTGEPGAQPAGQQQAAAH
jgi:hypothetical protein